MSAYEVTGHPSEAKDQVVDLSCPTCGDQQIVIPVVVLLLLTGAHIPCPSCLQDSATCVARIVEVKE